MIVTTYKAFTYGRYFFNKFEKTFFKIILPSARPAITAGLALVAMECLADFGTVSFFSVQTLTTAIYNSWLAFDDLNTANQLSFILLLFIRIMYLPTNELVLKARGYWFQSIWSSTLGDVHKLRYVFLRFSDHPPTYGYVLRYCKSQTSS